MKYNFLCGLNTSQQINNNPMFFTYAITTTQHVLFFSLKLFEILFTFHYFRYNEYKLELSQITFS